jgi:hypothetical protein
MKTISGGPTISNRIQKIVPELIVFLLEFVDPCTGGSTARRRRASVRTRLRAQY